jgi:hypothetical protein
MIADPVGDPNPRGRPTRSRRALASGMPCSCCMATANARNNGSTGRASRRSVTPGRVRRARLLARSRSAPTGPRRCTATCWPAPTCSAGRALISSAMVGVSRGVDESRRPSRAAAQLDHGFGRHGTALTQGRRDDPDHRRPRRSRTLPPPWRGGARAAGRRALRRLSRHTGSNATSSASLSAGRDTAGSTGAERWAPAKRGPITTPTDRRARRIVPAAIHTTRPRGSCARRRPRSSREGSVAGACLP